MPISSRFVVNSTIFLLLIGFLALLAIVGMAFDDHNYLLDAGGLSAGL